MSISIDDAIADLTSGKIFTVDSLYEMVDSVSAAFKNAPRDSTYLLNSGDMLDGLHSSKIIAELQKADNVFSVAQTDVGKLLGKQEFATALGRAVKDELFKDPFTVLTTDEDKNKFLSRINEILNGKDGPDVRYGKDPRMVGANSMWDRASRNYVKEAVGNFKIIAPVNIHELSVFASSEIKALLENKNIGTIDGIPHDELVDIYKKSGNKLSAVTDHIQKNSLMQVVLSGLDEGNYDGYMSITPDKYKDLLADETKLKKLQEAIGNLDLAQREEFKVWSKSLMGIGEDLVTKGGKVLNKLGPLGTLAGFVFMSFEANAAESAGDHEKAIKIAEDYAVDSAGSYAGETVGAAIGGIALAAAAVAGATIAAPVAAVVVIGASIVGGIFGADGAAAFYKMTKNRDDEGKREIIKKIAKLLYGEDYTISSAKLPELNGKYLTLNETVNPSDIFTNAKTDIAWRYALRERNSFVVPGIDYDKHNKDGSLDLYNPDTGTGYMTDEWLKQRANFLVFDRLYQNSGDKDGKYEMSLGLPVPILGDIHYVDHVSGDAYELLIDGVDGGIADTTEVFFGGKKGENFSGEGGDDWLFGAGGDDHLSGGEGEDHIEGGEGDDKLTGGKDNDILQGDAGNDTYLYKTGDGNDTIRDFEGTNHLEINGKTITHLTAAATSGSSETSTVYLDDQNNTYTLTDEGDLLIKVGDGKDAGMITIDGFNSDNTKNNNHFGHQCSH